ncbi:MAG: VWA domain-containing protein [Ignavibacteriae bacterium]|nr:VWA domain-containing protein [Ignavibacteriota bacterium]
MRLLSRISLLTILFLLPAVGEAQPQLNLKRVVTIWPTIELYYTVACNGSPLYLTDKSHMAVTENGVPIHDFMIWCPDPSIRCAISVALVFDASGSMSGAGNAGAKAAGNAFIDLLDGVNDQAAILWFTSTVTLAQPMTVYTNLLHNAVNALPASGATAVWDGMYYGVQELISNGVNPCRVVIVLTDGGDNSSSRSPAETISLAMRNRIRIFTIGLGSGIQSSILQNIATTTGGRYYETPSPSQLTAIYQEISTIIFSSFQECLITYQSRCTDGSQRAVELSVLNVCGGNDTEVKSYKAPKDTTTYSPLAIGIASKTAMQGTGSIALPLELRSPIVPQDILYGATCTVRFDPTVLKFSGIRTPPGSIYENLPITISPSQNGAVLQIMDRKVLEVASTPALLAELLFEAQNPRLTDTVCSDISIESWIFDAGCFRPVLSGGRLCIRPGSPEVICDVLAPAALTWSPQKNVYQPDSFTVMMQLNNVGTMTAFGTRVVLQYDKTDFDLLVPLKDTLDASPTTIIANGSSQAAWLLRASPHALPDTSRITFTALFDNHAPVVCTRTITIPRAESSLECTISAPPIFVDSVRMTYSPDPVPVTVSVLNNTTSDQTTLSVELVLPSDLQFVTPDSASNARRPLLPSTLSPQQTGVGQWLVRRAPSTVAKTIPVECITRRFDNVVSRCVYDLYFPAVLPPLTPAITPQGPHELCEGDSIVLDAGAGYSRYSWNTGARTRMLAVRSTGVYYVTVTDIYGRNATAPPVVVNTLPAPAPQFGLSLPVGICLGDSVVLDPGSYPRYLWNTGDTTRTLEVRTAGVWFVRVTTARGCVGYSDTVRTVVHPLPDKPIISQQGDTLSTQPATTYRWYLNRLPLALGDKRTFVPGNSGRYIVRVTNAFGCTAESDVYDFSSTAIGDMPAPSTIALEVYPNPVTNELTVTLRGNADKVADITLISILGQKIAGRALRSSHGEQSIIYDLSTHPAGLYFVTAAVHGRRVAAKVVKQ